MHSGNTYILLACTLLRLDKSSGPLYAYYEVSCDLWVEGTAVASLLYSEDASDPSYNLVRGGVGRFVEIDYAVSDVVSERAL